MITEIVPRILIIVNRTNVSVSGKYNCASRCTICGKMIDTWIVMAFICDLRCFNNSLRCFNNDNLPVNIFITLATSWASRTLSGLNQLSKCVSATNKTQKRNLLRHRIYNYSASPFAQFQIQIQFQFEFGCHNILACWQLARTWFVCKHWMSLRNVNIRLAPSKCSS